jgi:hypothetical protein
VEDVVQWLGSAVASSAEEQAECSVSHVWLEERTEARAHHFAEFCFYVVIAPADASGMVTQRPCRRVFPSESPSRTTWLRVRLAVTLVHDRIERGDCANAQHEIDAALRGVAGAGWMAKLGMNGAESTTKHGRSDIA